MAVIKAELKSGETLIPAIIGDSSKLRTGDWVVAVGNPVGLDFTATQGIISSPKRSAHQVGAYHMRGQFIQTDAALNHGNSGGPLVNSGGQVIGINTLVRSNTESIGFSIPINQAMSIFNVLRHGKKPTHAYVGVELASITPDFAKIHNDDPNAQRIPENMSSGALISKILPQSPAAIGGLRKNDIITAIDGLKIHDAEHAEIVIDKCQPGIKSKWSVARGESGDRVEKEVIPLDLYSMIDEKRKKLQQMLLLKPSSASSSTTKKNRQKGRLKKVFSLWKF